MQQLQYRVTTSTGLTDEVVEVRWADQLLGEREGPRHGIKNDLPLHLATYWCWAALKRTSRFSDEFQAFLNDPDLDIEPVKPEEVPPTEPAPAG